MDVKAILEDKKLVDIFWNKQITLNDGSVFATLKKYLETIPEGKEYLSCRVTD